MVGLDLLEIDRLEQALARRPGLAERLFTDAERAYAATSGRPARHLAARFCAKEAVSKALEVEVLRPREIEGVGGGDAPPGIAMHGAAAVRAADLGVRVRVSLTHTRTTAGAVAVLEGPRSPTGRRRCPTRSGCATPTAGRSRSGASPASSSWSARGRGSRRSSPSSRPTG